MIGWSVDLIWSWTSHVRSIYMSRENLSRYLIQFKLPPMRYMYTVANPRRWAGWLRFSNSLRPLRKIYSAWRQRSRRFRVAQEWREANCDGEESIHGHYLQQKVDLNRVRRLLTSSNTMYGSFEYKAPPDDSRKYATRWILPVCKLINADCSNHSLRVTIILITQSHGWLQNAEWMFW